MKIYKIRHNPTGLFLRNARHAYGKKPDTLHKKGKVYTVKPSFYWFCYDRKTIRVILNGEQRSFPLTEFEIIEYKVE